MRYAWTALEDSVIRTQYEFASIARLQEQLPGRTWNAITQRGRRLGVIRKRMRENAQYKQLDGNWFSWKRKPDGYIVICGASIGPPKYRKYEHRYVWEQNWGPIPEDHEIHHIDGNRENNRIENLECLHESEHHSRDREVREAMTRYLKDKNLWEDWLKHAP